MFVRSFDVLSYAFASVLQTPVTSRGRVTGLLRFLPRLALSLADESVGRPLSFTIVCPCDGR